MQTVFTNMISPAQPPLPPSQPPLPPVPVVIIPQTQVSFTPTIEMITSVTKYLDAITNVDDIHQCKPLISLITFYLFHNKLQHIYGRIASLYGNMMLLKGSYALKMLLQNHRLHSQLITDDVDIEMLNPDVTWFEHREEEDKTLKFVEINVPFEHTIKHIIDLELNKMNITLFNEYIILIQMFMHVMKQQYSRTPEKYEKLLDIVNAYMLFRTTLQKVFFQFTKQENKLGDNIYKLALAKTYKTTFEPSTIHIALMDILFVNKDQSFSVPKEEIVRLGNIQLPSLKYFYEEKSNLYCSYECGIDGDTSKNEDTKEIDEKVDCSKHTGEKQETDPSTKAFLCNKFIKQLKILVDKDFDKMLRPSRIGGLFD